MDETVSNGYDWYWQNYNNCMGWIKKHEVAYWKSQALSLKLENEEMFQILQRQGQKRPNRPRKKKRKRQRSSQKEGHGSANEIDFELTAEWTDFFKTSLENKEKMKKERELKAELDTKFLPPQESCDARQKEMYELYGKECSKILGMETVINLEFERYIDRNSPEYWPPMPLNLSVA